MTEIKITCTKCGKSITQCKCNNTFLNQTATIQEDVLSQRIRIKQLEEENAELKAQLEKMKCCGNCKYEIICRVCGNIKGEKCENFNKWELSE